MPVNLNPPPLPNPDTIRATAPTAPTDDAAPSGDVFAQLIIAAGTLSPSGTARAQKEGRDERDAKIPVDPVSPDALAIDWAALAMRIAASDAPAVPTQITSRTETSPAVGRTSERLSPILAAKVDPADTTAPLVAPPGREPATPVDTRAVKGEGSTIPFAAPQASAAPPVAHAFTAAASPFTDAGAPASKAATADAVPRDFTSPQHDRSPPPVLQAAVAAVANAIVRDERQPGGVARDSATAALDAAAIHAEAMTAPHAAAPAPPAVVTIAAPVGQPGFAEEVAGKLVHVVLRQDRAELRLNPAELGPVQIRIDVDGSSTQLTIVATQPATREALEHALPHLRELLATHGIALGQASVHDGRAQDRTPGAPWTAADAGDEARGALPAPVLAQGRIGLSDRLIDTFV